MILSVAPMSRTPSEEQAALVRVELSTILASDSFSGSKRCQDFVEFVVEHALAGDYDSLSERFLGVQLFGRAVDYETATDSIVRVRANDVRKRLALYYAGRQDWAVRIDLIAGGYVPEFHWKSEEKVRLVSAGPFIQPPENAVPGHTLEEKAPVHVPHSGEAGKRWKRWLWSVVPIAVLVAVVLAHPLRPFSSNFDRFWAPVLEAPSPPLLSLPTTDTFQTTLKKAQTFGQSQPDSPVKLGGDDLIAFHNWHISLPVVQATLSVALALGRKGKTPLVRMGTDLRQDEVRGHPVIAIGSFSNPWTEQNVSGLRFTFDRGASDQESPRIRDSQNPQRSWSLPRTFPQPQTKDYAIVTRTFDPVTREPFVSLAGLHSFGNQIAGEFVSQESSWNEVAKRAPTGWEKMNLQVVLETNIIGTTPSSPKIIDVYFWK
jgi:hypothetical protein